MVGIVSQARPNNSVTEGAIMLGLFQQQVRKIHCCSTMIAAEYEQTAAY